MRESTFMTVEADIIFNKRLFINNVNNSRINLASLNRATKHDNNRHMKMMKVFAIMLLSLPALATLTMMYSGRNVSTSTKDEIIVNSFVDARAAEEAAAVTARNSKSDSVGPDLEVEEMKQSDLFPSGFDSNSCLSRTRSDSYRKKSPFAPSPYLISMLRNYEARHARCGPNTKNYNAALQSLINSKFKAQSSDCKYIVWVAYSGLGNRILTIASAFLYALLNDRVLLVQRGGSESDLADLFCEPFPGTTWLLPDDFPVSYKFDNLSHDSPNCFGYMLKNGKFKNGSDPALVYVDVVHDYNDFDKMFFCDKDHGLLDNVKWVIIKSDNYFVPSLFLMDTFRDTLFRMFPEKDTTFHHLGKYLFHPTNQVWGLVTRFYDAYLANADERIGIQVRTFYNGAGPFPFVMDQIQSCIKQEKLISKLDIDTEFVTRPTKRKALLVTSLLKDYSEKLKTMYWLIPTQTGEVIGVYQPSHERVQMTDQSIMHNRKAWAEMYLLSLMDKLVTSAWSTFGYVAQGLGGLRPFILYKSDNMTVPNPACGSSMSIEPCFHAPPFYDCKLRRGADTGAMDEHVRHCEDVSWGLKVVNPNKL